MCGKPVYVIHLDLEAKSHTVVLFLKCHQVRRAMTSRDGHSRTILTMALASKNKDVFEAALTAVEEGLTKDEVCLSLPVDV